MEPSLLQCESNRLNVWQIITKSVPTIWKRWRISYLYSLQQPKKWIVNKENLKSGNTVLIREENLPLCKWLLGRVVNPLKPDSTENSVSVKMLRKWTAPTFLPSSNVFKSGLAALF
ncbi:uncharacterized protein TNCV_3874791 [Trichonephila clavipes]|nr:uncharacterized protein TNCV_3874791 [Trichonephila clavipes]